MKLSLKIKLIAILFFVGSGAAVAQSNVRIDTPANYDPWLPIPESDILWKKEVWRVINIYEAQNIALRNYPEIPHENAIAEYLLKGIREGTVNPYADDSMFETPLTMTQIDSALICNSSNLSRCAHMRVNYANAHTNNSVITAERSFKKRKHKKYPRFIDTTDAGRCKYPDQIEYYGIHEKWIFDKGRGLMVVQIIALAPMTLENGKKRAIFWLHYPDIRPYLAKRDAWSNNVEEERYSLDEFFDSRQFSSLITKVGNNEKPDGTWKY